jgi:putative hydrolase of the HAD superfamily
VITTLLFDFGGTLAFVDYELLAREFSRPGRELTADKLERAEYMGRRRLDEKLLAAAATLPGAYDALLTGWFEAAGIPKEEFAAHRSRFREIHREQTLWRVIRPGTFEALERMRRAGLKLGIVSNAEGQIEGDAKRMGLTPFFNVIVDSHVVGVAKPDPRIFQIALDRIGSQPEETLFAGDIYSIDMLGAKAAGIEGRLIDQMELYDWIDHPRIKGVPEFHEVD